ncbi:TonB-dependent receptor [Stakelama pacifica]|uniref:TonB-dependent receptor n=1 Tax=Stakelama pacifica TaxID=517720 RepID=A0A4R6FUQ6_9SPHN|nr:TonB-dependent receptor [Stakelama pacifica]TDN85543.1 TonB-dependent receptor [Stakelama pacifica]GGO92337.1 TonB-dependent receptor [Stakelama pacifica]
MKISISRPIRPVAGRTLRVGVSILALVSTGQAFAQQAVPAPSASETMQDGQNSSSTDVEAASSQSGVEDIIVTGIRESLATAQSIKRDSDTVVDAVTAQDIGALPDRSVTEALQRIPGVSISRFAAGNDSDHFSVEGSGAIIRGLNYVRSEFNGRDTFSVSGGRSLNFEDVPPELLAAVEAYKNQTADMIEGGIAGSVNLVTRKPFDSNETLLALSADMNYGDFSKRGSPSVSALGSTTFETGIGRFGILAGGSFSQLYTRADGIQVTNYQARFNGSRDINGDGIDETDTFPGLSPDEVVFAPLGAGVRTQDFNRKRIGMNAAAQFETYDESLVATLQFIRSDARQTWGERTFESAPDSADRQTFPLPGTNYTFDDEGLFETGIISLDRGYTPNGGQQRGVLTQLSNRGVKTRSVTDDFGGNVKWKANDRLSFNFDAQYVHSTRDQTDFSVLGATFADIALDMRGDTPDVEFLAPDGSDSAAFFANPNNSFYRSAMDHFEKNDGHEWAFRGDATYDFGDEGFLKRAKFGARYADRDQTVRYTLYNWGVLSETWDGSSPVTFADAPQVNSGLYNFTDQFRGDGPSGLQGLYLRGNPAAEYDSAAAQAQAINAIWRNQFGANSGGWTPVAQRAGVVDGTPFLPSEIYTNSEATKAAYLRLDFGGNVFGNTGISGNVGVRYIETTDKATGFFTFPTRDQIIGSSTDVATFCAQPSQTSPFCGLPADQQQAILSFSDGTAINNTTRNKFSHWLPSFNLKVEVAPGLISRFAYSKAISRPGFEQLQSTIQIAPANGISVFRLEGGSRNSNPNLRPVEANQFDLTAEYYFSRVGSLTAAVFYKDLTNVIVSNVSQTRSVTNNGVTQDVLFVGPENSDGHSHVQGVELAYQQTYDFLPGILSGLGVQANYTFVDASNIPQGRAAEASSPTTTIDVSRLPLAGLSKHTVNAAVFYEKGPISMRAAYNWRSRYLLSIRDEIAPFLPIFADSYGQLDGSIIYSVNDKFKIGIQAVNLLDSITKTESVINAEGQRAPRSYFRNDRRFSITTRMRF